VGGRRGLRRWLGIVRLMRALLAAALGDRLEQKDRTRDGGIQRSDRAPHRDPHERIAATADRGPETLALAADDDRQRAAEIRLASGERCARLRPDDADTVDVEVGKRAREIVDRAQQQVLDRAGGRLDRRGAQRRLAPSREHDAVHAGRLRTAQQRAEVLGILERVEHEDERRLGSLFGAAEHVGDGGERARLDDDRDTLVPVEPGDRGQRAALHLDDRDPKSRRVQDELLEGRPPLRDDEHAVRHAPGGEHLLDRAASGDELLIETEDVGWLERGRRRPRRPVGGRPERGPRTGWTRWTGLALTVRAWRVRTRTARARTARARAVGPAIGRAVTRTSWAGRSWREAARSVRSPVRWPIVGSAPAIAVGTRASVWRAGSAASL